IATDRHLDLTLTVEQPLELEHPFAGQDDLLQLPRATFERHLAPGESVAIGGDCAQHLTVGLEQGAVEVVAHILLRHREMSLVDEQTTVLGSNRDSLQRVDLIDHRKFRGGQSREREAAATTAQYDALSLARHRDLAL